MLDDFAFFLNLILDQHPVGVSLVVRLSPGLHAEVHTGDTEEARGFQGFALIRVLRAQRAQGRGGVIDADFEESTSPGEVAGAAPALPEGQTLMDVLLSMPDVGEDADFERPVSYGRPDVDLV